MRQVFFLKDLRTASSRNTLSLEERTALDQYLSDVRHGPADGEMDIEWQETGRGYYGHLHELSSLQSEKDRNRYLAELRADIVAWLTEDPRNHSVRWVRDILHER